MLDFQQKRTIRRAMYSRVTIITMLVFVLILIKSTYGIYQKEQLSADTFNATQKQYNGLKNQETMLNSEIAKLKTNEGIEEEIRSKFDVAKPGETVVVVLDNQKSSADSGADQNLNIWQKFLNLFR